MKPTQTDSADPMVNHPTHYSHGGMEVIDILDAFGHLHYNLLNAIKYVLRAPYKGHEQDIDKAIWYLTRMKELMAQGHPGYYKEYKRD